MVYYLHKNRNFIRKIMPEKRAERSPSQVVDELASKIDDIFYAQRRDLYFANLGIDPKNEQAVALAEPFVDLELKRKGSYGRALDVIKERG